MRTALDTSTEALDAAERSFVAQIREHGWFRTGVFGDAEQPGFSFTTGFCVTLGRPELIMFSTRDDVVHDVFWDVFRDAQTGKERPVAVRTRDVFANLPAYVFPVAKRHYADHLGWSRWFYDGDDFPCLQIVWPDRAGKFPWEAGFDTHFIKDQPDLTENGWASLAR